MENELFLCEYSCHTQKKHFKWLKGLDSYFIRLQTEGLCLAKINGESKELTTGDLILCKPGDICELIVDEYMDPQGQRSVYSGDYFLLCRGSWVDKWWERTDRLPFHSIHNQRKLITLWKELILEMHRIYDKDKELLDYLLRAFCLSIDISLKDSDFYLHQLSSPVLAMKNYIEEHANQTFKIKDVANHVGFSVSRASHLFKEKFGKTIIEYAQEIRLNTALKLIKNSDMSLEQIAEIVGFGSYTYFHRVFRKNYGQSPTEYLLEQ